MTTIWTDATTTSVDLEPFGERMPDGQYVTRPGALVLGADNTLVIEGDMPDLQKLGQRVLRCVQPHRHSNLEREVGRARQASSYDSKEVEIERLKEALDVALTIIGREDLR